MKRLLTACLGLVALASTALAQGIPQGGNDITPLVNRPLPPVAGGQSSVASPTEEQAYIFFEPIYPNDSVRFDPTIPTSFSSGTEWRGVGTILAPSKFYEFYNESVYNSTSNIYFDGTNTVTDSDYVAQFAGAGAWSLDTARFFVYQDPNLIGNFGGKIVVLKTGNFYGANPATWNGLVGGRAGMEVMSEYVMTPETLATRSAAGSVPGQYSIFPTVLGFDPPLSFNAGEHAVIIYVNDDAPAIPIATVTDQSEVQRVGAQLEWKTQTFSIPASATVDSLPGYKSLGVVVYRDPSTTLDTIYVPMGGRLSLTMNGRPRTVEFGLLGGLFKGSVDVNAGVRYHYGTDAREQGITSVSPNPAREAATINFSLKETAPVTLEVYDATGTLVTSVPEFRYIPGVYSYTVQTAELPAGNYLVRMTAGEAGYSSRFTVVK